MDQYMNELHQMSMDNHMQINERKTKDIVTLRVKLSGTVYCNRSCLWVCLCVCGSVTMITRNSVHRSSPNWVCTVGEGSDRLQLIKFWPSRASGKGVCGGAKIFGSSLLQPARSVCVSLGTFFIIIVIITFGIYTTNREYWAGRRFQSTGIRYRHDWWPEVVQPRSLHDQES